MIAKNRFLYIRTYRLVYKDDDFAPDRGLRQCHCTTISRVMHVLMPGNDDTSCCCRMYTNPQVTMIYKSFKINILFSLSRVIFLSFSRRYAIRRCQQQQKQEIRLPENKKCRVIFLPECT